MVEAQHLAAKTKNITDTLHVSGRKQDQYLHHGALCDGRACWTQPTSGRFPRRWQQP